jgi:hypothetical protein
MTDVCLQSLFENAQRRLQLSMIISDPILQNRVPRRFARSTLHRSLASPLHAYPNTFQKTDVKQNHSPWNNYELRVPQSPAGAPSISAMKPQPSSLRNGVSIISAWAASVSSGPSAARICANAACRALSRTSAPIIETLYNITQAHVRIRSTKDNTREAARLMSSCLRLSTSVGCEAFAR